LTILDSLLEITKKHESSFSNIKVHDADRIINTYHEKMLERDEAILCLDGDKVLGYTEYWLLNYDQLGRKLCGNYQAHSEKHDGNICYIANICVPNDLDGSVMKYLRNALFSKVIHRVGYVVGHSNRKQHHTVSVLKITDVMRKKYFKEAA